MRIVDLICPQGFSSETLKVNLATEGTLRASVAVRVLFDYSGAGAKGVQLPIELVVLHDKGLEDGCFKKVFRRSAPTEYTFTVPDAGTYMVLLREQYHNRQFGSLTLMVEGERVSPILTTRRQQQL